MLWVACGLAGCDQFAGALRDGVLDFIESSTADLLEEVIPLPTS